MNIVKNEKTLFLKIIIIGFNVLSLLRSESILKNEKDLYTLDNAKGVVVIDYNLIQIPENKILDLIGLHYLHNLNKWIYLGYGIHAPMFYGNYGGFMAFDITSHIQHKFFKRGLINLGFSIGGGGGGSSIEHAKKLSGQGKFIKNYVGLGYSFESISLAINYGHFRFFNSLINNSQVSFHIQKPVSFSLGKYSYLGNIVSKEKIKNKKTSIHNFKNIVTVGLNNISQYKPKGYFKDEFNLISLQFSHYPSKKYYAFFLTEVGYKGLPAYNQVLAGLGCYLMRFSSFYLSGQLGVGSGGYSPAEIDTGPGFLINSKVSLEYSLNNKTGFTFSSGYLFAPKGSSKNYSFGLGINNNFSPNRNEINELISDKNMIFRGFRINLFHQINYNVRHFRDSSSAEKSISEVSTNLSNISLLSVKTDYFIRNSLFFCLQISVSNNKVMGYPGYGELLAGIGIQNKLKTRTGFQYFFQNLIGTNIWGLVLKPEIGFNISLSNDIALFGQVGEMIDLNSLFVQSKNIFKESRINSQTFGFGFTYRFSLLGKL